MTNLPAAVRQLASSTARRCVIGVAVVMLFLSSCGNGGAHDVAASATEPSRDAERHLVAVQLGECPSGLSFRPTLRLPQDAIVREMLPGYLMVDECVSEQLDLLGWASYAPDGLPGETNTVVHVAIDDEPMAYGCSAPSGEAPMSFEGTYCADVPSHPGARYNEPLVNGVNDGRIVYVSGSAGEVAIGMTLPRSGDAQPPLSLEQTASLGERLLQSIE